MTALPALSVAARAGDAAACAALLDQGAAVDARSAVGWTALHEAAWADAEAVVRVLIAAGATVDARSHEGLTPAMVAAGRGAAGALAALCANLATLGLRSADGRTALESALQEGFLAIALDLVHAGAQLDTAHATLLVRAALHDAGHRLWRIEPRGPDALRAGHWLWLSRRPLDLPPVLLQRLGPWVDAHGPGSLRLVGRVHFATVESLPAEAVREGMPSPSWRVRKGWTEHVSRALHGEIPADALDERGFLPVLDAIRAEAPAAVQALLDRGARARQRPHYGLMRGATLLHNAAEAGNPRTVRALLDAGADVDARTATGWTALMVAAGRGHLAAVHELLRDGADMEARNAQGQTAMAVAQLRRRVPVARALLVAGNVPLSPPTDAGPGPEASTAGAPPSGDGPA